MGTQSGPGMPRPAADAQPNPFGNAFYGAGSGLIRGGLGAYGEKILGSSSEYVQSNVSGISRLLLKHFLAKAMKNICLITSFILPIHNMFT